MRVLVPGCFRTLAVLGLVAALLATTPPARAATSWRTLVLIYTRTDAAYQEGGYTKRLLTSMTWTEMDTARTVVRKMPVHVYSWSDGLAAQNMTVKVISDHKLRTLTQRADGTYWVSPSDIRSDLDRLAPRGAYDSLVVIWKRHKGTQRVPVPAWGLTRGPGPSANYAGYTTVTLPDYGTNWDGTYKDEIFVHEWLHQVEGLYRGRLGISTVPPLHDAQKYGYSSVSGSWKAWYVAYMTGRIRYGSGYIGVYPKTWTLGTPRNY
ncbi:MAG: hypothetical protein M3281_06550 [Chloroflexota bacterium]|nr:hypothetical protein [Chloroflexota bacterium]